MPKGFCYFFPGIKAAAELRGREPFGVQKNVSVRVPAAGPGEASGALVWIGDAQQGNWCYKPEAQRWAKIVPDSHSSHTSHYFVGIDKAEPPGPEVLQRSRLLAGVDLQLGGKAWHVPQYRLLPQTFALDPETGGVLVKANSAYDRFGLVCEHFIKKWYVEEQKLSIGDLFDSCVEVLALNYYVGKSEVAMLEMLDTRGALDVMRAAIDADAFEAKAVEELKKNSTNAASGS